MSHIYLLKVEVFPHHEDEPDEEIYISEERLMQREPWTKDALTHSFWATFHRMTLEMKFHDAQGRAVTRIYNIRRLPFLD